ncbi:MAG: hypothetical protein JWO38_4226 [Gemmataceae bacterium]|nr:hypothetical protein [Gemmataceae bacterium]
MSPSHDITQPVNGLLPDIEHSVSGAEVTRDDPGRTGRPGEVGDPASLGSSGSQEMAFGAVTCPRFIGDYEILRLLGSGGMGNVFVAKNLFFGREEALKMIHDRLDSREARKKFVEEMHTQAGLDHANIVKVHYAGMSKHAGKYKDQLYFVTSLESGDLGDAIEKTGPFPPARAADLIRQLAKAIAHAHARGVIHCDLKPKNILLAADGTPKVTDFGLVKFLAVRGGAQPAPGRPFGTPNYMPPEQARGEHDRVDQRSDVYGLGAVLYELLTGQPPYPGASRDEVLERVKDLAATPKPPRELNPKIPPRLEAICLRCLRKYPAGRYTSADELAADLHDFLQLPWWRRRWREIVITLLLGGILSVGWEALPSPRAKARRALDKAEQALQDQNLAVAADHYAAAKRLYLTLVDAPVVLDREELKRKLAEVDGRLAELQDQDRRGKTAEKVRAAESRRAEAAQARQAGDRGEEFKSLNAAAKQYEELLQLGPAAEIGPGPRCDYGKILTRLAELHEEDRNPADAEKTLEDARKVLDGAKVETSEIALARAEVEHIWGVHFMNDGRHDKARERYLKGRDLRVRLWEEKKDDREYCRDLARSHGYLGDVQLVTDPVGSALDSYLRAKELRQALAEKDPQNVEAQCLHARDFGNLASAHEWQGGEEDLDKAGKAHRDRLDYYLRHVEPLPKLLPAAHLTERADTRVALAELLLDRPAPPAPEIAELLGRAEEEYTRLRDKDSEKTCSAPIKAALARLHVVWGRFHHLRGKETEARGRLQAAKELFTILDDDEKAQPEDYYHLAVVQTLLGVLPTTSEFDRLNHQLLALDRLEKAVRKGFRNQKRLERDLGLALLGRAHPRRFGEIIADLHRRLLELQGKPA